jgi:hypothetical protein
MTGAKRRAWEAERTWTSGRGHPLLAAALVGGGRQTVALGLAARRTGRLWLGAQAACRGRKRGTERPPQVAAALPQLAAAQAPPDPPCRTSWTSTRLPAPAAWEALPAQGESPEPWPAPSTTSLVL